MATYRKWLYAKPMAGDGLGPEQFECVELPMPEPDEGQALVRVRLINVHSATRTRMANGMTRLGDTDLSNYACAVVVKSRDPAFREGDVIACQAGWQEYQLVSSLAPSVGYGAASEAVRALNRTNSQWTYAFRPEMARAWPAHVLMDVFGTSGMTAYFGMRECGPLRPGTTVAVAGASGSVGSIAAQLARIAGSRVTGFAGGSDRCRWVVDTLAIDGCIDYRAGDLDAELRRAFPDGIDVFSDGIGGTFTETVARHLNRNGRILAYGSAAAFYADTLPATGERPSLRRAFGISEAVENLLRERDGRAEAWIVDAFYGERLAAEDELSALMAAGRLKPVSHVVSGFEALPSAIVDLYRTPRAGKLQIEFSKD